MDVKLAMRCKDKQKSFKELADSELQLVTVNTQEVMLRTERQLEQFVYCMNVANKLAHITPGAVEDQDAQKKWMELQQAINSMKEALASSKEKDGAITIQMNQAVDVWMLLKHRLEPYTRTQGMQLNRAVIDLELTRLKEVHDKLGDIAQEVNDVIKDQMYDDTELLAMFPSGIKGDETMEKMYKEINEELQNIRDELSKLERDEAKLFQDLESSQVQVIAEQAERDFVEKKKESIGKRIRESDDDIGLAKGALKDLQKNKQKAQQELAEMQASRNLRRVNAALELEMDVAKKMQQDRKWLEDRRRILQMKLLGHTGSTQGEQHLIFILDKSYSMHGDAWNALQSAFNDLIQQLKAQGKDIIVTVVLFSHQADSSVACQQRLQSGSVLLPATPVWGGTTFSAGWREAWQQDKSARSKQVVGRTMVIFMTDGCASAGDVQGAVTIAKDMYHACGSNMVTFGIPLGPSSDRGSVRQIVRAGNGGRTSIPTDDASIDTVLYASQADELATVFDKVLTAGVNIEEDVKKKMKLLEEEEKRMTASKEEEMKQMKAYYEMQQAHQDARIEAAAKSGNSQQEALLSEIKLLETRHKDLEDEVKKVDVELTNAAIALKGTSQYVEQVKGKIEKLNKIKRQREKELNKEAEEKQKQIRKKYYAKEKQLEAFSKKLGTADPQDIVQLRSAVTDFSDAKRELRVQLMNKLAKVQEIQKNVSVFQLQIERLVRGDEQVAMNPKGKAMLCEQWYDSHFEDMNLLQGHEADNFTKIAKHIMGESSADLEQEAMTIVLSCRFTTADCFPEGDEDKKSVRKRLYGRCAAKVEQSASVENQQRKVDALEAQVDKLTDEIEDEEDNQAKSAQKEELRAVKAALKEAKKQLKVDEKAAERKTDVLEEPIKWVLDTITSAVENPFLLYQDSFMRYRMHQLVNWSEDALVSVVKSYRMLTDGLTFSPLTATCAGSPIGGGGYPKARISIEDA